MVEPSIVVQNIQDKVLSCRVLQQFAGLVIGPTPKDTNSQGTGQPHSNQPPLASGEAVSNIAIIGTRIISEIVINTTESGEDFLVPPRLLHASPAS